MPIIWEAEAVQRPCILTALEPVLKVLPVTANKRYAYLQKYNEIYPFSQSKKNSALLEARWNCTEALLSSFGPRT